MKTSRFAAFPVAVGLMLFGAGCGSSTEPTSPAATPSSAPAAAPAPAPGIASSLGNCDNPYYPLQKGTKAAFTTSAGKITSAYTWEVTNASPDHVTLAYHFGKDTDVTTELNCTAAGIQTSSQLNLAMSSNPTQATSKTTSASGEFLPKDLHVGSTWQSAMEMDITNTNPQLAKLGMTSSHMKISTINKAISEETVTVPAGTFTAIKVESTSKITVAMGDVKGIKIPDTVTETTAYEYFVKGKGLVKTETSLGSTPDSSYRSEATSIVTP